jgi:SET domain-containing protein
MKHYRPLPECLTIKESSIDGLGLFSKGDIPKGTNLGISHIHPEDTDEIIRTPLGGFYNSPNNMSDANCVKIQIQKEDRVEFHLTTTKDIKEGEELLVNYTFYKLEL